MRVSPSVRWTGVSRSGFASGVNPLFHTHHLPAHRPRAHMENVAESYALAAVDRAVDLSTRAPPRGAPGKNWAKVLGRGVPPNTPKAPFPAPLAVAGARYGPISDRAIPVEA